MFGFSVFSPATVGLSDFGVKKSNMETSIFPRFGTETVALGKKKAIKLITQMHLSSTFGQLVIVAEMNFVIVSRFARTAQMPIRKIARLGKGRLRDLSTVPQRA